MLKKRILAMVLMSVMILSSIPFVFAKTPIQAEFYVSVNGSDSANGSKANPFKTIARAQEEVRKINKNMTGDIIVYLREGVHVLDKTLEFNPEDSGSNGFFVRYKGYSGETATVSGGRKIEGWTKSSKYENLYEAEIGDSRGVGEMYVNDKYARRAKSEVSKRVLDVYKDMDATYPVDGLVVSSEDINSSFLNVEDIQVEMSRAWRGMTFNIRSVTDNGDGTSTLHIPLSKVESGTHGAEPDAGFWLINAIEELDIPGEFYHNTVEKKLYYYPREGENMETAEVYIPELEVLMQIEGPANNDKVKNIAFENLTFAHGAWYRDLEWGFYQQQAGTIYNVEAYNKGGASNRFMIPAAIKLYSTNSIMFTENIFKGFHGAGVGLHNGAENTHIVGNVFEDIGDSAVTVGEPDLAKDTQVTDGVVISENKPVTSNDVKTFSNAVSADGMAESITSTSRNGWSSLGSGSKAWVQIDLLEPYNIDRIELVPFGNDNRITRKSFEILGSNDPEFNSYAVLAAQGEEPFPHGEMQTYYVDNENEYRYVRLAKTNTEYMYVTELRIINEDMEYYKPTELPKDTKITDNYITRCGMVNVGAPGVTAYYAKGVDISHNEFYDLPYSAVSCGWGWSVYKDHLTGRDNKITNNEMHGVMQQTWDGSAIYTLGPQYNSMISGNYIYDSPNFNGGIYHDQASSFFNTHENVLEDLASCFLATSLNAKGLRLYDNYYSAPEYIYNPAAGAEVYDNNELFNPGDYPLEAIKIIKNSGLREKYQHIKEKDSGRLYELTFNLIFENLLHGSPTIVSDSRVAEYTLHNRTSYIDSIINTLKTDGSVGGYPKELVDELRTVNDEAKILAKERPLDRVKAAQMGEKLADLLVELKRLRNTDTMPDMIAEAKALLSSASIGNGEGQVLEATYNDLKTAILESEDVLNNKGYIEIIDLVYLEKSIEKFNDEKITLDIKDFIVPEAMGDAVIDSEAGTVHIQVKYSLDRSAVQPTIKASNAVKIHPNVNQTFDFTKPQVFTISTLDGSQSKDWTIYVDRETVVTGDIAFDDAIENKLNWTGAGASERKYHKELYGDTTLKFKMHVAEERSADWPSITFRNKYIHTEYTSPQSTCYILVFNPGLIEFHRYNNGQRTQLYGSLANFEQKFGPVIQSDAFKYVEDNDIELTTRNEDGGVRIILTINGIEIINILDDDPNAIKDPGYLGIFEPGAAITYKKAQ